MGPSRKPHGLRRNPPPCLCLGNGSKAFGGPSWGQLLWPFGVRPGASWGLLWASWGPLGTSWRSLGGVLGPCVGVWGPKARSVSVFLRSLAPSWAWLGVLWGRLGRLLGHLGAPWAVWGRAWRPVGPSSGGLVGLFGRLGASASREGEKAKHLQKPWNNLGCWPLWACFRGLLEALGGL